SRFEAWRASVARNLRRQLVQRNEVLSISGSPPRARSRARPTALSDWLFCRVLPCSCPSLSGPSLRMPSSPPLSLRRGCLCWCNRARRLRDDLQPQQACLPPQCLDLLFLHLGLVLLLTLTHIRHPVLQGQIDDPCQLVRRRGHGRLNSQPPFHPPQKPSQRPLAVVQTL